MDSELFEFDFTPFRDGTPKGLRALTANKRCLILYRDRDGYREKFCIAKTGKGDCFSLFRVNLSQTNDANLVSGSNKVITGPLNRVLALMGYKTGYLTPANS